MTREKDSIRTETYLFKKSPLLANTDQKISLGGFSGLVFEGVNPDTGRKTFLTHTDRGPNSEQEFTKEGHASRRFAVPNFNPQLVRFELEEKTRSALITHVTSLKSSKNLPLSGRPNLSPLSKRKDADEVPRSISEASLDYDPSGLDLEAILQTEDGSFWMVEEYRPSILQFSKEGRLKARFIPKGSHVKGMDVAKEVLPASLMNRQMNRGFEGLARHGDKLYAFLQSPFNPQDTKIPVIEFDLKTHKVTHEYTYPLESTKADKIGDAVSIGNNKFLVIEQNSKTDSKCFRKVFEVSLSKENPTSKRLIADLCELGFSHIEKFEGIEILGPRNIALISDNDFSFSKPDTSQLILLEFNKDLFE